MKKKLIGVLLIAFPYFLFGLLNEVLLGYSPESLAMLNFMPMVMGAVSSFFYLFEARCLFSKVLTLFSFFMSSAYLFWLNHGHLVLEIPILLVVSISCSFFLSYLFISEKINIDTNLDKSFVILVTSRFFMSPEIFAWEIALVMELMILFLFNYIGNPKYFKQRKGVFFSLSILLLVSCLYGFAIGVLQNMNIVVVAVLAAAGAGAIQFLCFSKTQREQTVPLVLYLVNTVILGFILRKEGEIVPQVTIWFILGILGLAIFYWLTSKIHNKAMYSIMSESKNLIVGIIFPALCLLNNLFLYDSSDLDLNLWIASLFFQVTIFHLLQFILKNEDKDGDREG